MNDKYFLDTNIIVYSFDSSSPARQQKSNELVYQALAQKVGCISYQVIQEFINVSLSKFKKPLSGPDCQKYIMTVLEPLCEVHSSIFLFQKAIELKLRWRYSLYDSLIISAALEAVAA